MFWTFCMLLLSHDQKFYMLISETQLKNNVVFMVPYFIYLKKLLDKLSNNQKLQLIQDDVWDAHTLSLIELHQDDFIYLVRNLADDKQQLQLINALSIPVLKNPTNKEISVLITHILTEFNAAAIILIWANKDAILLRIIFGISTTATRFPLKALRHLLIIDWRE